MNSRFVVVLIGLCGSLVLNSPAHAQAAPPPAGTGLTAADVQNSIRGLDAPNGGSVATTYQSKFSVSTSTDKSTASLDVGDVIGNTSRGDFFTAAFSAKAPFDSSKSDTLDLGSLSGLTAGTQAHLALGWTQWSPISSQGILDIDGFQNSAYFAQLYGGYGWRTSPVKGGPTLRDAVVAAKLDPTPLSLISNQANYVSIIKALNDAVDEYNKNNAKTSGFHPLGHVTPVTDYPTIARNANRDYGQIVARYQPSAIPSLAVTLDGNQQSFSFASNSNPTKVTKEDKNGTGASVVASVIRSNWLASVSFSYTHTYTAQPSSQICSPIAGTTSTQCVNGAIGAPKEMVDRLITAEYRVRATSLFALSPQVQYSEADSKWAVQVPVYLTADANKVLNGGVTLGWTSATHFGAAIFVGKPFSFK
jgi:hypothetical protein